MSMEDLYEHMKSALRHFNLKFGQMDQVKVTVVNGDIHFDHGGLRITILEGWK